MYAHCEKKFDNSNGKNPTTQSIFASSFKVAQHLQLGKIVYYFEWWYNSIHYDFRTLLASL